MKRTRTILLITLTMVLLMGCSTKKAYEGENTSESVQVDNNKNETDKDKIVEIDEKSATQLVSERLDTTKYSVEKEDEITVDSNSYYVFKILENGNALSMRVAVDKVSGELYAYKEDNTIAPYKEFTLYDESKDAEVNWEGTYNSDTATLELMPADDNSFEFILTNIDSNTSISGVAQASGNEATYNENGCTLTLVNDNTSISVNESGTSTLGISFQGTYTKK